MTENQPGNNALLCDAETGVCELPVTLPAEAAPVTVQGARPVTITYFTDPICSSCWGIEPQLRKLKLQYGRDIDFRYYMGGLLPDWSYNSGGISKPSDVAHHWDEVSLHYKMPIDGDVWLEDPLHSSYPPSIAFKAAQAQDETKAIDFLRAAREMVFLEKKNITKWLHLEAAAIKAGLDVEQFTADYNGAAESWFRNDLQFAGSKGVRGFPSVFVSNASGQEEFVYGVKPYTVFEKAVKNIYPAVQPVAYDKSWSYLFKKYPTLTTREFAELSEFSAEQSEQLLKELQLQQHITVYVTKNGALWKSLR